MSISGGEQDNYRRGAGTSDKLGTDFEVVETWHGMPPVGPEWICSLMAGLDEWCWAGKALSTGIGSMAVRAGPIM
jgi:hypothetical protein